MNGKQMKRAHIVSVQSTALRFPSHSRTTKPVSPSLVGPVTAATLMRLFVSLYLLLCGLVFGAYALAAGNITALAVSALVAVAGALFLSTTQPKTIR